jgi:hypothetical protein
MSRALLFVSGLMLGLCITAVVTKYEGSAAITGLISVISFVLGCVVWGEEEK